MGGLVARYYIERSEGHQSVRRLIMVGTPNGGSIFGEIPDYIKLATGALILALNFATPYVGQAITLLWILNKNKDLKVTESLFRTLKQMQPKSEFLQLLYNSPAPPIPYILLSGHINRYLPAGRWEKAKLRLSGWLQQSPHDAVVPVASMKAIPESFQTEVLEVPCHHMNYFHPQGGAGEVERNSIAIAVNLANSVAPVARRQERHDWAGCFTVRLDLSKPGYPSRGAAHDPGSA
ncbi:MAG: hypothetical protein HC880_18280 [Bacteroidia bacterium]|nr:hypothetical protein [Bacteroidia bacterium]